jgi:hypothetical protein
VVVATHDDGFNNGQHNRYQVVRRFNQDFTPDLGFGDQGAVVLTVDPNVPATQLFVQRNGSIEVRYPTQTIQIGPDGK